MQVYSFAKCVTGLKVNISLFYRFIIVVAAIKAKVHLVHSLF